MKAFVSSTRLDLLNHRARVIQALRKSGIDVDPMEDWTADSTEPKVLSADRVDGCAIFILIVARRRGFVPAGGTRSITQLEYDAAVAKGVPILVYLLSDDSLWISEWDERKSDAAVSQWREHLVQSHTVEFFDHRPESIDVGPGIQRVTAPTAPLRTPPPTVREIEPPPNGFVGRAREIEDALKAVKENRKRIIVIWGPGGMGKSALAGRISELMAEDYPAQLCYKMRGLEKAGCATPVEVMRHMISSLVAEAPSAESDVELRERYSSLLRKTPALILLDDAHDEDQVEAVRPPSNCLLIVTSRRQITLQDQHTCKLEALPESAAVDLLRGICDRVGDMAQPLARVCEHIPFILQLVARMLERNPFMSPAELLELFKSDRLCRAKPVNASIRLSMEQLPSDELRDKLVSLSIFRSAFSREAAAAVWGSSDSMQSLNDLGILHEYSLVIWRMKEGRLDLHDHLRTFLRDSMEAWAPDVVRRLRLRHAQHFCARVEQGEMDFLKGGQALIGALRAFGDDWLEIQSAFTWLETETERDLEAAKLGSHLVKAAFFMMDCKANQAEQRHWAEAGVKAAGAASLEEDLHVHLRRAGWFKIYSAPDEAMEWFARAVKTAELVGDIKATGKVLGHMGVVEQARGNWTRARERFDESLAVARKTRDSRGEAIALGRISECEARDGHMDEAVRLVERAIAVDQASGEKPGEAKDQIRLYGLLWKVKNSDGAVQCLLRAAQLYREIDSYREEFLWRRSALSLLVALNRLEAANDCLERLVELRRLGHDSDAMGIGLEALTKLKNPSLAIPFFESAFESAERAGERRKMGDALGNLGCAWSEVGDFGKAIGYHLRALDIDRSLCDARGEAIGSWDLGETYEKMGEWKQASERMQVRLDYELSRLQGLSDEERAAHTPAIDKMADRIVQLRSKTAGK